MSSINKDKILSKRIDDALAKGKDKMVELVTDRKGHDKRYALDNSKYKSEFGDPSSITFKEYYKWKYIFG